MPRARRWDFESEVLPRLNVELVYGEQARKMNRQGEYWRGPCPFHDDADPASHRFSVHSRHLTYRCFSCGAKGSALSWLAGGEAVTSDTFQQAEILAGLRNGRGMVRKPPPIPEPAAEVEDGGSDREDAARRLWKRSLIVPRGWHPARRWAGKAGDKPSVWPADWPWPRALRWLPASRLRSGHGGSGSLVAAFRPIDLQGRFGAEPAAVQLIAITSTGARCLDAGGRTDGGLHKRTIGRLRGAVFAVQGWSREPVAVVEGVADALAAVALWRGSALALGGTGGRAVYEALARIPTLKQRGVRIALDYDGAGLKAAGQLAAALRSARIHTTVARLPDGAADPAEARGVVLQSQHG